MWLSWVKRSQSGDWHWSPRYLDHNRSSCRTVDAMNQSYPGLPLLQRQAAGEPLIRRSTQLPPVYMETPGMSRGPPVLCADTTGLL